MFSTSGHSTAAGTVIITASRTARTTGLRGRSMGTDNGPQDTWGEWRRHLRSGPEQQLVRDWYRRVECPTCKADAGRACRTSNGHPTDPHRARHDAAGPLPYEQRKQQGLWASPSGSPSLFEMSSRLDYLGCCVWSSDDAGADRWCSAA